MSLGEDLTIDCIADTLRELALIYEEERVTIDAAAAKHNKEVQAQVDAGLMTSEAANGLYTQSLPASRSSTHRSAWRRQASLLAARAGLTRCHQDSRDCKHIDFCSSFSVDQVWAPTSAQVCVAVASGFCECLPQSTSPVSCKFSNYCCMARVLC